MAFVDDVGAGTHRLHRLGRALFQGGHGLLGVGNLDDAETFGLELRQVVGLGLGAKAADDVEEGIVAMGPLTLRVGKVSGSRIVGSLPS